MREGHIIIAGTGRAGTTLLMQLFTKLGLDTGYSVKDFLSNIDSTSSCGLEIRRRRITNLENLPRVFKSPYFFETADQVLSENSNHIQHIFIPIRNLEDAARSRIRVQKIFEENTEGTIREGDRFPGGLTGTNLEEKQETVLGRNLTSLIVSLAKSSVPFSFIVFPNFAQDPDYLYKTVKFLIPDTSLEEFRKIFQEIVDLSKIHIFG